MATDQQLRAQAMEFALKLPDNVTQSSNYGQMGGYVPASHYKSRADLLNDASAIFKWIKGRK